MTNSCQKRKKLGVTTLVSEINRMEDHSIYGSFDNWFELAYFDSSLKKMKMNLV